MMERQATNVVLNLETEGDALKKLDGSWLSLINSICAPQGVVVGSSETTDERGPYLMRESIEQCISHCMQGIIHN